jgi:hypothetical protein
LLTMRSPRHAAPSAAPESTDGPRRGFSASPWVPQLCHTLSSPPEASLPAVVRLRSQQAQPRQFSSHSSLLSYFVLALAPDCEPL